MGVQTEVHIDERREVQIDERTEVQERSSGSVTIADIARELGVSKSTVSRVINGKGRIGEETRNRVMSWVTEHNYTPNPIARGLAQNRTFNIAVVIPKDADRGDFPFFQNCLVGITETVNERGFDAVVVVQDGDDVAPLRRLINNHKVDGVILTRVLENDRNIDFLIAQDIPFVVIGTLENESVHQIDSDHASGCYDITKMMIENGCTRMQVLGGNKRFIVNRRRWEGFMYACKIKGVDVSDDNIVWNLDSQEKISQVLPELMKKNPQCLVCMDDSICLKTLAWLKQNDYEIPADVQVISFYDGPVLESNTPSVTALNVDPIDMSSQAGNLMLDVVEGKSVSSKVNVGYSVKVRETSRQ